jgi:hypothetical protein
MLDCWEEAYAQSLRHRLERVPPTPLEGVGLVYGL